MHSASKWGTDMIQLLDGMLLYHGSYTEVKAIELEKV